MKIIDIVKQFIEDNYKKIQRNFDLVFDYLRKICEGNVHYVLISPDFAFGSSSFFDDNNSESKLRDFYSNAAINVNDSLYLVNNYYEERKYIVKSKIFNPQRNIMYLVVEENYCSVKIEKDYCQTDNFKKFVIDAIKKDWYLKNVQKRMNEHSDATVWDDAKKNEMFCIYMSELITERIEYLKRSYLDHTPIYYRVAAIVYKEHGLEFKKPSRFKFDDM